MIKFTEICSSIYKNMTEQVVQTQGYERIYKLGK